MLSLVSRFPIVRDKDLGKGEEKTTLFVTGLPVDAREDQVRADLEPEGRVMRVVMKERGGEVKAFIRFETAAEATQAMQGMRGGKLVCQSRVNAELVPEPQLPAELRRSALAAVTPRDAS